MEEAGLPPGIINFLPGNGADVGDIAVAHPEMSGLHFLDQQRHSNIFGKRSVRILQMKFHIKLLVRRVVRILFMA